VFSPDLRRFFALFLHDYGTASGRRIVFLAIGRYIAMGIDDDMAAAAATCAEFGPHHFNRPRLLANRQPRDL